MSKFVKVSQLSGLLTSLVGGKREGLGWLENLLDPDTFATNTLFLTSLVQNWTDKYSGEAYNYALEMDKSRGYDPIDPVTQRPMLDPITGKPLKDPWQSSQGHLEKFNSELWDEAEQYKKDNSTVKKFTLLEKPTEDVSLKNQYIDESSPEYKAMEKKLGLTGSASASTSGKFTKTSQKQQNVMAENIKKLLPRWDIPNVIAEMDKVANQPNLTPDEKRQKMAQVLQNFERDIAPLSKYLAANGLTAKKPN
jgi:hypothetical protein